MSIRPIYTRLSRDVADSMVNAGGKVCKEKANLGKKDNSGGEWSPLPLVSPGVRGAYTQTSFTS